MRIKSCPNGSNNCTPATISSPASNIATKTAAILSNAKTRDDYK
jgi:hypothetical protein